MIRISEAPLEEITKFTYNQSGDNLTTVYTIVGIVVVGIISFILIKNNKKDRIGKNSKKFSQQFYDQNLLDYYGKINFDGNSHYGNYTNFSFS